MSNQTTLHFFCGKMASGKSTLAQELSKQHNAILLCEDDWLAALYADEITNIPSYVEYSTRLKKPITTHIQQILSQGISIVLDFPANTLNQRDWFRHLFNDAGVAHMLHYVEASDELCKHQLRKRSNKKPKGTVFTSDEEFNEITAFFQPPTASEGFNTKVYSQ